MRPSRKRKRGQPEDIGLAEIPLSPNSEIESPALFNDPFSIAKLEYFAPINEPQLADIRPIESLCQGLENSKFAGRDSTFIQVAQLVADQVLSITDLTNRVCHYSAGNALVKTGTDQPPEDVMTELLSKSQLAGKCCSLKEYASLVERDLTINSSGFQTGFRIQKAPLAPRIAPTSGQPIFKLDAPYACIQRNGVSIEIASSALPFWEELGLSPSHDRKNLNAFCIYPANEYIREGVVTFLDMVKAAYQSCNLGLHELGSGSMEFQGGLVSVPFDRDNPKDVFDDINVTCETLGSKLAEQKLQRGNTVIYMLNLAGNLQNTPALCVAFLKLFDSYGAGLGERRLEHPNDLVLQIVPSDFVWDPDRIIIPSPADYKRLAFEVYNRCCPSVGDEKRIRSQYLSAPAIRLAKIIPKTIEFRLAPEISALFPQSDSCIHLSYAWNPGDDWCAASWTDNLGALSWNASYYLGKDEEGPWQAFMEIAKEVWETTLEMLKPGSGPWRLFVCKDSPTYREELEGE